MADVFISYARADRPRIEPLASAIEKAGLSVWWDRHIEGGSDFSRIIERELEAASTVIVAWSKQSIDSRWVRDEADHAIGAGKLLPVSLDGTMSPLGFRQMHLLDLSLWRGDSEAALPADLHRALAGGKGEAASPAVAVPVGGGAKRFNRPGLAILPFENRSPDETMGFVADGLTEDVTAILSANRHISVSALAAGYSGKNAAGDLRQAGAELGVRYVTEGSLRSLGGKVRVTVQLANAETGATVWARRFDTTPEELESSADELAERIAANLFGQLCWAEAERAANLPEGNLSPWDLAMRAMRAIAFGGGSPEVNAAVQSCTERALELDPNFAPAHALLAWAKAISWTSGQGEGEHKVPADIALHLQTAHRTATDDFYAQTLIGAAESFADQFDQSRRTLERVTARQPAHADAWHALGRTYAYLGRYDDALQALDRAETLSPDGGFAPGITRYRSLVHFFAGDYRQALEANAPWRLIAPGDALSMSETVVCHAMLGDEDRASATAAELRSIAGPDFIARMASEFPRQPDAEKGRREYAELVRLWGPVS